jgi:phage terminase small subunit
MVHNTRKGRWPHDVTALGADGVRARRWAEGPVAPGAGIERRRRERFAMEYLRDMDARAAAVRSGYSAPYGSRLLQMREVQVAIQKSIAKTAKRAQVDADRVVLELARVAFGSISDVVSWDADGGIALTPSADLSPDVLGAVAEVTEVRGRDGATVRVKMGDKLAALTLLAKHLGMLVDHVQVDTVDTSQYQEHTIDELRAMHTALEELQSLEAGATPALGDGGVDGGGGGSVDGGGGDDGDVTG